jgi:hypothetical protein
MLREATKSLGFCKGARVQGSRASAETKRPCSACREAQVLRMLADVRFPDLCPTIDAER